MMMMIIINTKSNYPRIRLPEDLDLQWSYIYKKSLTYPGVLFNGAVAEISRSKSRTSITRSSKVKSQRHEGEDREETVSFSVQSDKKKTSDQ